ncbi:MAG TPA: ABC transporter permease [Drouetiella sp.]
MRTAESTDLLVKDPAPAQDPSNVAAEAPFDNFDFASLDKKESVFGYTCRSVLELKNIKFALASFVVNNLRRRYRRSVLGFAWSLLNPLLTMAVMTAVFSLLWHSDPKKFGVYVFTGLLPWTYITDSITMGSQSLVQSEAFLKKVYIPKSFFPLVAVSTETANFAFSLASLMAMALIVGVQMNWTVLLVPAAIALLFLFNFSVTLILAVATVYFRDLTHIIKVGLSTVFYLVPIVYSLDMVPEKYRALFLLNPVFYFIDLFRSLIYLGVMPEPVRWAIPCAITAVAFCIAFLTLMKTEKDLIYRL